MCTIKTNYYCVVTDQFLRTEKQTVNPFDFFMFSMDIKRGRFPSHDVIIDEENQLITLNKYDHTSLSKEARKAYPGDVVLLVEVQEEVYELGRPTKTGLIQAVNREDHLAERFQYAINQGIGIESFEMRDYMERQENTVLMFCPDCETEGMKDVLQKHGIQYPKFV